MLFQTQDELNGREKRYLRLSLSGVAYGVEALILVCSKRIVADNDVLVGGLPLRYDLES